MKPEKTARRVVIEQNKKFSESALWRLQREYFEQQGINAWVNQVPFYITSNPFIATCYAKLVIAFMRDWVKKYPDSKNHPFYILELGTGSGRFSFYVLKTLVELVGSLDMKDVSFVYIMSDFTKNNIKYYETHPALKPYLEKGLVDFAIFDMESDRSITLFKKNIRLNPETLVNPLTVFANYIFDTVPHDSFAVHEGKLYELLISLATDDTNMSGNRPTDMEKITTDYHVREIKGPYYHDPVLDDILTLYKSSLKETSFLFPIGSFKALNYLRKLAQDKLFVISTDKGYSTLQALDNLGHPSISFHGSFSMMVNFHAIEHYFKNSGGDSLVQSSRKGIRSAVFTSGIKLADLPNTYTTALERIEGFSPSDYFTLHRRMSDSFQECTLDTIAAHMHLAQWDPHMYLKINGRINSLIPEADSETLEFMATNMPKLAANYYYMPKSECILFEIGVFFHAIKNYKEALKYYQEALPFVGEQFGLYYNIALCYAHCEQYPEALGFFKKALEMDKESKEAKEWIDHIEKGKTEPPGGT